MTTTGGTVAALVGGVWSEGEGAANGRAQRSGRESRVPGPGDLRVADVTMRPAPVVPLHLTVGAARKVARHKGAAVVLVEAAGRLVGLLDERALASAGEADPIARSLRPIRFSLQPAASAARARDLFIKQNVSALPVAAGAFLLGVVARADLERALAAGADVTDGVARAAA
jgi:CBS domain-containing protein